MTTMELMTGEITILQTLVHDACDCIQSLQEHRCHFYAQTGNVLTSKGLSDVLAFDQRAETGAELPRVGR